MCQKECENCWMMKLEDSSFQFRFKNAAFIVLENILSSGYGLFVPETDGPIIFNSILMIIGRIIVCYMLSKILSNIYTSLPEVILKLLNISFGLSNMLLCIFQLCFFVSKLKENHPN